MSKKLIRYILQPLICIGILFAVLLFWHNETILTITMNAPNLHPRLYYADANQGFSEKRALNPYTKGNTYIFEIPDLKHINFLRFDPTTKQATITINSIALVKKRWFKTTYFILPKENLHPIHQIKLLHQDKNKIHFQTTGKDPQFIISLANLQKHAYSLLHIDLLLSAVIGYLLLSFIYHLYKRYRSETPPTAKLILYALFLSFALFKTVYYKEHVRFGYPPDETAHLSYISFIQKHHGIVPDFHRMPNYLSHPPLYYEIVNLAFDPNQSLRANVDNFRTVTLLLYQIAFILLLYLGFRADFSILGDFVYLTFLVSVPMHAYMGASISNDTLAILGGALFALGFWRLLEKRYDTPTYLLFFFGIFISYFSKLTAALLIFFALIFYLLYLLRKREWISLHKWHIFLLVVTLMPILYYQISIMLEYHALVPTYNVTHHEAYLHSGFYTPEQYRVHLSAQQWFDRMIHYIQSGWFGIHSHHSFGHPTWHGYIGLLLLHIFAIISFFIPCPKTENSTSHCLLGKFTLIAVFMVLLVQYIFSYKTHLNSGYLGGLQPRYLLPFMFSFAIMAAIFVNRFASRSFILSVIVIALCIQAIYSDFFYFLLYYK